MLHLILKDSNESLNHEKLILCKVYFLALVLVLVKCYDINMVLLPFYVFITSLIKPEATNQQKKVLTLK